jgi:hypothetical protein
VSPNIADLIGTAPAVPWLRGERKGNRMLICGGELVTGKAAMLRLLLRELIYEKILVGPVVVNDGTVARLIKLPTGGARMETWAKGVGWIEAPEGSMALADFMPGKMKPVSAELAARVRMPVSEH